jgi:hypothetical protein
MERHGMVVCSLKTFKIHIIYDIYSKKAHGKGRTGIQEEIVNHTICYLSGFKQEQDKMISIRVFWQDTCS